MRFILGVDEAGRGPIAGPVAVGVVRAPLDFDFFGVFPKLNDSKKLSEKRREALFDILCEQAHAGTLSFCVKSVDAKTIDSVGISPSVRECVHAGIRELSKEGAEKVFLDGLLSAPDEYEQETIEGGDGVVPVIMLASVAAKVSRDRLMRDMAKKYPQYGFEKHKGYGTRAHYEKIKEHGMCEIHRRSFIHI
jgi:ribonuclease HII